MLVSEAIHQTAAFREDMVSVMGPNACRGSVIVIYVAYGIAAKRGAKSKKFNTMLRFNANTPVQVE